VSDREPVVRPAPTGAGPPRAGRSPTILLVDDNAAKRFALLAALTPLGYPIVEVDSGFAALRCLGTQEFAVILLDVRMPIMDGFETADLIRRRRQSELTPIIFITAHAEGDILNPDLYVAGAVDFIFTPVAPGELRAKVSHFIQIPPEELLAQPRPGTPVSRRSLPVRSAPHPELASAGQPPVDLHGIVDEALDLVEPLMRDDIELSRERDPNPQVVIVERDRFQRAVVSLCLNAGDAMPLGGTLTVRTTTATVDDTHPSGQFSPGTYGVLEVTDSGEGMDKEAQKRIFDSFFSGSKAGDLASVFSVVKQGGGHLEAYSEIGLGTTFRIYLPSANQERAEPGLQADPWASGDGTETILLVEDDDTLRPLVTEVLEGYGYTVLATGDSTEALTIAKENRANLDLLLTDMVMPGLDGGRLAAALIQSDPNLKVLFTSGYPSAMVTQHGLTASNISFIQKPFLADELARKIRLTLGSGAAPAVGMHRVLIADEDPTVRSMLAALVAHESALEVVGAVRDVAATIEAAGTQQPDITIVDAGMAGSDLADLLFQVRQHSPKSKVIVFGGEAGSIQLGLAAGADAYLVKGCSAQEIIDAATAATRSRATQPSARLV
jgi:CheY-like chemotaxis protein